MREGVSTNKREAEKVLMQRLTAINENKHPVPQKRKNKKIKFAAFVEKGSKGVRYFIFLQAIQRLTELFAAEGWQPQPIMALQAIQRLTELFAAGVKTCPQDTFT